MKQIPQQDRILVLPKEVEEKTAAGLIIPKTAQEQSQIGKIVSIGVGTKEEPMFLKEGQFVLFGKFAGVPVEHEGMNCLVMKQSDVLCIVEGII